jgi:pimeloyl-ACP methyl ester carboxylesterase
LCVLGLYATLSPIVMQSLFLFRPIGLHEYPDDLRTLGREVSFRGRRGQLCGILALKPGSKRIAVIHHGQGGNIATHIGLLKMMLASGCSALIYDYAGFGMSGGRTAHPTDLVEDGISATNYVEQLGYRRDQIVQVGVSLGSGVAAEVTSRRPSAAAILIAPYTSLRKISRGIFPWLKLYPDALFDKDIGSLDFVQRNTAVPLLVVHAELDKIIPVTESYELHQKQGRKIDLIVYPNVSHGGFSINRCAADIRAFLFRNSN